MKLYQFLSRIGFQRKHSAKFMFITFLGIHIPLIGIIVMLIFSSGSKVDKPAFFLLALCLTLLATGITLFVLNMLTLPLRKTQHSLHEYLENDFIPNLPGDINDELGLLMRDINSLIMRSQVAEHEREQVALMLAQLKEPAAQLSAQLKLLSGNNQVKELEKQIKIINEVIDGQKVIHPTGIK